MLTLARLFQNMAHGELSNISVGNSTLGNISPADYSNLISHVQLGLTALHKRFLLRTGEVVIQQYPDIRKYYLRKKYAQTNAASTEPVKYILDTLGEPFEEDLFKIEQVYDELGNEFRINDSTAAFPIYTPAYNCLQLSPSTTNPTWYVIYRANYPEIAITDNFDPDEVDLDIPPYIVEALQAYVTARIMTGRSHSIFEGVSEGDKYMARYEQLCLEIEIQNLDADDNDLYDRAGVNGWV